MDFSTNKRVPEKLKAQIGNRLATLRTQTHKETQLQMAERMGISRGYYANLENGLAAATYHKYAEVAKALKVDPDWLIFGETNNSTAMEMREDASEPYVSTPTPPAPPAEIQDHVQAVLDAIQAFGGMDQLETIAKRMNVQPAAMLASILKNRNDS